MELFSRYIESKLGVFPRQAVNISSINIKDTNMKEIKYKSLNQVMLAMLRSPNIASKEWIYRFYDTEVQGNAVIRPGEADACVISPLPDASVGIAISVDGNPLYGKLDPYWGGATAVAEAMRNVAAVGATPSGMTDCLNYGNPENPEVMWEFTEGVKGISEAAKQLGLKNYEGSPVPIISGNVSLYNESSTGKSIAPSPIICCVGTIDDYSKAVTQELKASGNQLILVGERFDECGGSAYYQVLLDELGANVPMVRWESEKGMIYGVIDAIDAEKVSACHDVSNGGLAITLAEMVMNTDFGIDVDLSDIGAELRNDKKLFSESSGFVMEVQPENVEDVKSIFANSGIQAWNIGTVTSNKIFTISDSDSILIQLSVPEMKEAWSNALREALA